MEGTGHEGVILHGVGKHHQLGAAQAVLVPGELGGLFDDAAHLGHGIHIDAGLGGAHVNAGADHIRGGHGLGDGADQLPVALGGALLHQGGEAADDVDTAGFRSCIQCLGNFHIAFCLAGSGHQRNGGDGNALIDNGNAELRLDLPAHTDQVLGAAGDLVIGFFAADGQVRIGTVQKADAHGDGPDIQVLIVDHVQGGQNVVLIQHGVSSNPVHGLENVFPLNPDGQPHLNAQLVHPLG